MKLMRPIDWSLEKKLELGSGINPQPGYVHLDISDTFPGVDIVCDLSHEQIPCWDSSLDEIIHNHLIEHIPWRLAPRLVRECGRCLRPGGKMIFRTPDLEFICRTYLDKKITLEYPSDMDELRNIFGEFGPSQWALVKLFSGQDYPSNFHFACYDLDSITRLLKSNGFSEVRRIKLDCEFSPGELQVEAVK